MQCDMCGKESYLVPTEIEGTVLNVCKTCAQYGKTLRKPKRPQIRFKNKQKKEYKEPNLLIVENYAQLIRNAREKTKLNQEQFAKKVNEKESVIHNLEGGRMRPPIKLAKKLEKFLGITLIEELDEDQKDDTDEKGKKLSKNRSKSSNGLTIGDLINLKK